MSAKALQRVEQCIERQVQYAKLNAFVSTADASELREAARKADAKARENAPALNGKVIAVKDNIATTSLHTTAASRILGSYKSPYDATVVATLLSNGAIIAGKTNLDEFGMGSHTRPQFTSPVLSHLSRDGEVLSPGGSSGGSAVAVATGQSWAALGTDTGGSVRLPAAYAGVVGFKPSYGRLSRWGVIAYANSLDTVGMLTQNVADAGTLFGYLNHYDPKDPTSLPNAVRERIAHKVSSAGSTERRAKALRIGIPLEYNIDALSKPVRSAWSVLLSKLQEAGHSLHSISLPSTQQALSAYYVLAPAEASSNLAKYDGVRYGSRADGPDARPAENLPLFAATRGKGFGPEVQRRVLLGAYTLSSEAMDNYFVQAQRVRRLVQREFDGAFALPNPLKDDVEESSGVDVLIAPTAPTLPPTVREVENMTAIEGYMNDVFTVPASLAGLPAVSVPVTRTDHVPEGDVATVGMQVIGQFGDDDFVLKVGEVIEALQPGPIH